MKARQKAADPRGGGGGAEEEAALEGSSDQDPRSRHGLLRARDPTTQGTLQQTLRIIDKVYGDRLLLC